MGDELAAGPSGPRRRWTLPVLGAAVLLLFGYVVTHRYPAPVAPDRAGPTTVPEVLRPASGDGLPRVTGDIGLGPAGLRVLVGGPSPRIFDLHTGRLASIRGLRLAEGERAVLQPIAGGMLVTVLAEDAVKARTSLLRDGKSVPVGTDVRVTPSRDGQLILSTYGIGGTGVTLADLSGGVHARWARPGLDIPLQDTPAGLVLSQYETAARSGADLLLVDPRTGQVRSRLATHRIPLAVSATAVAHAPADCGRACRLTVTDLRTGRGRDYPAPDEGTPKSAEFSPDGRRLALAVPGRYLGGRLTVRPGFAAVLDLAGGSTVRVPGVETEANEAPEITWSPDGKTLVLGVWQPDRVEVGLWSPLRPAGRLVVLRTQPPGERETGVLTVLS